MKRRLNRKLGYIRQGSSHPEVAVLVFFSRDPCMAPMLSESLVRISGHHKAAWRSLYSLFVA